MPSLPLGDGWRWALTAIFLLDGSVTFLWAVLTHGSAGRSDQNEFIDWGPYAFLRHPMYTAILLNGTAITAFAWESWLILTGVLPLHLFWGFLVSGEEKALIARHGESYLRYMEDVGQFFPRFSSLRKSISQPKDEDNDPS
ncbi:methyltransferase family protein [Candidatus Neomarinimicrobiota bacterium]